MTPKSSRAGLSDGRTSALLRARPRSQACALHGQEEAFHPQKGAPGTTARALLWTTTEDGLLGSGSTTVGPQMSRR